MLTQPSSPVQTARQAASVVVLVACGIFSPLMLGLGLLIRSRSATSWDYQDRWNGVRAFAALWAYNGVLLSPACALVYEALAPRTRRVHMRPRQSLSSVRQVRAEEGVQALGKRQAGDDLPEQLGEHAVVGRPLGGDLWQWVVEGLFVYPLYALMYHAVVAGRTGTGKSELLRRIAYMAAKLYHLKVVWVDGKGEWEDAARFQLVMQKAGCKQIGIFPLMAHNGWRDRVRIFSIC